MQIKFSKSNPHRREICSQKLLIYSVLMRNKLSEKCQFCTGKKMSLDTTSGIKLWKWRKSFKRRKHRRLNFIIIWREKAAASSIWKKWGNTYIKKNVRVVIYARFVFLILEEWKCFPYFCDRNKLTLSLHQTTFCLSERERKKESDMEIHWWNGREKCEYKNAAELATCQIYGVIFLALGISRRGMNLTFTLPNTFFGGYLTM